MARINKKTKPDPLYTHGGAVADRINAEERLRRTSLACLLWEDSFYEDGVSIANRIKDLVPLVDGEKVMNLAIEARNQMKLRHLPLLLCKEMASVPSHKKYVSKTLTTIIQRADELAEFLAIYWNGAKQPIAAQVKKGLAAAFTKFDAYGLAKYNRDKDITLRDVMFLCHPKPLNSEQAQLWKQLADNTLPIPDTWEVRISDPKTDKKVEWERLLKDKKLGALALLRNLRNFEKYSVDRSLVVKALQDMNVSRVLPFRFITAAKASPRLEEQLEQAFFKCTAGLPKLPGKTVLVIDVSGSMNIPLSSKSILSRLDSAAALMALARECCEECVVYATAGNDYKRIHATTVLPSRRGFGLTDLFRNAQSNIGLGGIFLVQCMDYIYQKEKGADRVIVFTDEQDCDDSNKGKPANANAFGDCNYLINIAPYDKGIGYGKWVHINGFSEAVLQYIYQYELFQGGNQ